VDGEVASRMFQVKVKVIVSICTSLMERIRAGGQGEKRIYRQ
jgi:hypothetical protein